MQLQRLMSELSIWRCSTELKQKCQKIWQAEKQLNFDDIAEERKRRNYDSFWTPVPASEPFRCVLAQVWPPSFAAQRSVLAELFV
jgi:hypothetical protein